MNQDIKKIVLCLGLPIMVASSAMAQQKVTGKVVNSANQPVAEVAPILSAHFCDARRKTD